MRGKIPHEEWPRIATRFEAGETLTEIARSYGCTAPAIRYIVKRISARSKKRKPVERVGARTALQSGRLAASMMAVATPVRPPLRAGGLQRTDLWARINTDIATYLTAMDVLASDDTDASYEALMAATDTLLRATARTRLELEKMIGVRKRSPLRHATV